MSKTTILVGAIIFALVGGGLLFYFAFKAPAPAGTQPGGTIIPGRTGNPISTQSQTDGGNLSSVPLPKFVPDPNKLIDSTKKLSFEERQRLSTFIGNMAGVVQTYGYQDFNGINGVADYFTVKGQTALKNYIEQLQAAAKPGYRQYGVADSTAQIALYYNQASKVYNASVYTLIYNLSNLKETKPAGHQIIDFELVYDGSNWKFNNVSLYTK
ncbi:MAG: hypothetical protein JNK33_06230 [Candidatus Doudnabacteria bacterium]|nr:hypothetical protein [Candidatus Doudnabacteria bacterium]